MTNRTTDLLNFARPALLSASAHDAYIRMIHGEPLARTEPGVQELIDLHLAVQLSDDEQRYSALSAKSAGQIVRTQALTDVRRATERAFQLTTLMDRLEEQVPTAPPQPSPTPQGRLVAGTAAIDGELEGLVTSAKHSVWSAQPGAARPELLGSPKTSRDFRAMDRGVVYRTIYESRARDSEPAAAFAKKAAARGGAVRHTTHPFTRMMIIDGATAVLPASHAAAASAAGLAPDACPTMPRAWIVTDCGSVDFVCQQFEQAWENAQLWTSTLDPATEPATSRLQRQILRGLLAGGTQGCVATDLSITQSYASTQLSNLRAELGLTRDQLIAWWINSPEQHIVD
jgi:hypothetical protein